jgi:hypothetical protein
MASGATRLAMPPGPKRLRLTCYSLRPLWLTLVVKVQHNGFTHATGVTDMCVIMAGTPWTGFRFYGPFANGAEAEQYQGEHLYKCDFWWIVPLEKEATHDL